MEPKYKVYDDDVICVGLFAEDAEADKKDLLHLGLRYLKDEHGFFMAASARMMEGRKSEWFLLPSSFGLAVGRTLIQQKVADAGLAECFDDKGFRRLVSWLVEMEALECVMAY